jgi:hypothetical protein
MALRQTWASYVVWGSIAVCAVLAASFTIALVVGSHRGIQIAGPAKRPAPPPLPERPQAKAPAPTPAASEHEIARMKDALRDLAADRDRLAARLEQIERTVGDITASIREQTAAPAQPAPAAVPENPPAPPPAAETPPAKPVERIAAAPAEPAQPARAPARQAPVIGDPIDIFRPYAAVQPPVTPPTPGRAPMQIQAAGRPNESAPTRTEFAVDLGGERSVDSLRSLWSSLRGSHAALEGLRPLVSIREGAKPGATEFRLIAGPLANAGEAARICAALQAKGATCHTAVFDGQRLATR